ncbi:DNA primase [Ligilactobacillus murinus]|uniref:DNA primase n=1 Tax=Ligilactobacillus murinus TaxID=1622 RepID=A0AAE7BQQ0_9LACO|nr:DNA primase [Ligilactobacillus murinus]NEF81939.1 DNA primase [Ligilactobacillus murinus]NEF84263.1 DNA primase [Ligilactobacillus murinus]NEF86537.1 DNA primase [Ligilactobacillus murinus]NEF88880.1 DNA primase [Ligilactobacillus murinus]NEF91148.1 DNA primase [Ligilactobacillus murinus]
MSLEFYAGIDNFKVDAKGNISITEKLAGSALKNKLDELQKLKADGVVRVTIESAVTRYTQKVDAETLEPVEYYERDTTGTWTTVQNEQLSLDVGEDQVIEREEEITADIIDSFLLTEKYELKSEFNPRKVLVRVAEGYSFDEIAKELDFESASDLLKKLNEARVEYAGMAKAWYEVKEDDDEE